MYPVATKISLGLPVAVRRSAKGKWVIGTRAASGNSINYLFTWSLAGGLSAPKGFNAYGGMTGLMWVGTTLPQYVGTDVVVTTHGVNGSASKLWLLATGAFVDNGWSSGFGNAGRGAWRPGGGCDEGLIVAADTGSFSPTYGLLIRFYDSADPACSPAATP